MAETDPAARVTAALHAIRSGNLPRRPDIGPSKISVPAGRRLYRPVPGQHFHVTPEAFFQIRGSGRFTTPGGEVVVNEGDLVILRRGLPHQEVVLRSPYVNLVVAPGSERTSVHLSCGEVGERPLIDVPLSVSGVAGGRVASILDEIVAESDDPSGDPTAVRSAIPLLIASLIRVVRHADGDEGDCPQLVRRVEQMVQVGVGDLQLSVATIAAWVGYHPDSLSRRFRELTGWSLGRYIVETRLQHARRILADTTLAVSAVGRSVGFPSAAYFTKRFHARFGCTPTEYRVGARP